MDILIQTETLSWLKVENTVETYLSDAIPSISDCSAAYAVVFKDGKLLLTDLREGERETRKLDIPGGHVEQGESPEDAVVRETLEETGVVVQAKKIVAYKKVTILGAKPEHHPYSYPVSYMAFYVCDLVEERVFDGNHEVHGRAWIAPEDLHTVDWCRNNKALLEKIIISEDK